jgi:hypothetical protein
MNLPDHGRCLLIEYRQGVSRAQARERLSLVEQAARGLLDPPPARARLRSLWGLRARSRSLVRALKQMGQRAAAARTPDWEQEAAHVATSPIVPKGADNVPPA